MDTFNYPDNKRSLLQYLEQRKRADLYNMVLFMFLAQRDKVLDGVALKIRFGDHFLPSREK